MKFTNERLYPEAIPAEIKYVVYEHEARYKFACNYTNGRKVLDAACGSGYGSLILSLEGKAREVLGIDISHEAVREARKRCSLDNVSYKIGDVTRLNLPENEFDVVVSFETIEHINEGTEWISEAYRLLKKGGLFIVSTPNRILSSPGRTKDRPIHPNHRFEYTKSEFIEDLEKKFKIEDIYGQSMRIKALMNLYITLMNNNMTRKIMIGIMNLRFGIYGKIFGFNNTSARNAVKRYWEKKTRVRPFNKRKEAFYMVAVCRKA